MMKSVVFLGLVTLPALASAAQAPSPNAPLPGIEATKPIVNPAPEPQQLPANEDGTIQIGKTRVKISGSITIDIGVGAATERH